ncbi:MAG TPA: lipopolysaccharide heptosyltransferase II [Verrucomicrobiae bacterium]|nr:lipopolysaccharide heptosyltransferase II [Verrucomicrobiae bacterium]
MNSPGSTPALVPPGSNILVRQVNWLGDAVMTMPALVRLRKHAPHSRITILSHEKLKDLWKGYPAADEIISFGPGEGPWGIGRRLAPHRFSAALILPNSPRSALESWFARIPMRVGYRRPLGNFLLTHPMVRDGGPRMRKRSSREVRNLAARSPSARSFRYPESSHQMHDYLRLMAEVGADPEPVACPITVPEREIDPVLQKFGLAGIHVPVLGLNAGAEYGTAKQWPVESFIEAAVRIQRGMGCRWVLFGTQAQAPLAERIRAQVSDALGRDEHSASESFPLNLAGRTTLRELIVLLSRCSALLTNDSGPMHLAAALGTPVVVPFGSTSPELTGPWPANGSAVVRGEAPCAPCFLRECPIDHRCMKDISVERVVRAFESLCKSMLG